MATDKINEDNYKILDLLSKYLNNVPDLIKEEEVRELVECGVSYEYSFCTILAAAFGLDIVDNDYDKAFFNQYFSKMLAVLQLLK